jgi:type IV secretory pathway VirB2 component (pilin)
MLTNPFFHSKPIQVTITASPHICAGSRIATARRLSMGDGRYNLQTSFTGRIAKGLSLVALVVGGLMFAYSESGSKEVFAGIVFGPGMALGAQVESGL